MEQNINLDILNNLSKEERAAAIEILKQYAENGESELLNTLKYADFEEIPVDIETFMHDKKYLGNALYDAEGRFTIFPYWEKCLKKVFPDNVTTAYNNIVFTGAIGLGKAQPLDAVVLCENGYKTMGELTLADKVYGNDGKLHSIVGIFPQGKKKVCRITFTDNTSTLCCDEHLWTVYNTKNQCWTTVETKQLINGSRNLKHSYGHRYKIPITEPIKFEARNLPIDPYIMGALLGDGCLKTAVTFSSNDAEIVNNIKARVIAGYEVRKLTGNINYSICKIKNTTNYNKELNAQIPTPNLYFEAIKNYNLNVSTIDKYIPTEYLYASIEDRIALLQGLMDTDGYISKDGSLIEFTTISKSLCDNFVFLVQSLGGVCHIRTKQTSYKNKLGEKINCSLSYNIGIKLPKDICPFKLTRKAARISEKALAPFRYIKAIEYVDDAECQCIYIDSKEHLYLTNDCIVTHNTMIADIILLYMLYRLLCLKDPYQFYGMQPIDKISIAFLNITIENAKGVALDKMNQMILSSDWFMSHGEMAGTTNLVYRPQKHIELIAASSNNQIIGRALFASFEDEANFSLFNNPEKQKKKMMKMITQIDARMKSRFMRTKSDGSAYLPTLNIIASSKDTEQSFLEEYIENKRKNDSQTTLIVDEPQWVVDERKDSPIKFYVAIGNKFLANELVPLDVSEEQLDEMRAKGYDLWQVPIGYLETFQENLDEAICSIIGIATASSLKYISGVKLEETKTDTYLNPFMKDVIEVGDGKEDFLQYSNFFDMSRVNPNDLARPMFIHLDMSTGSGGKGDKTGIAGVWITGRENNTRLPQLTDGNTAAALDENGITNDLHYKLAFSVSIKAPKGENISFSKNRNFIRWLRDQGFAIKNVSMDTFQSSNIFQDLTSDGFKTDIVSVDRVQKDAMGRPMCLPYNYFKTAIYERRLTIYKKCDQLTEEIVGLERKSDGHVDHTKQGIDSKDQCDAVCGAVWSASKYSEEYSYSYGDNLSAALDANAGYLDDAYNKQQLVLNFEEELKKINFKHMGYSDEEIANPSYNNKELEYYQDLSDGIIIF